MIWRAELMRSGVGVLLTNIPQQKEEKQILRYAQDDNTEY
jgi:hypothetical protein